MKNIPEIVKKDKAFSFLVNGKPFIMLSAEVHNSACSSHEYMKNVWNRAEELHCNTLLAPVYWELVEPQENQFHFDMVKELLFDARKHHLKLVLLWFGSWKNGLSTYAPAWVKTDLKKYPRTEDEQGEKTRTLSMFDSEIFSAELHSFVQLMQYIKEIDSNEQTVLAVQIENELGILGATRDFSSGACKQYGDNVPSKLMEALNKTKNPILLEVANNYGNESDLSWRNVFKKQADEAFMSWHYAFYLNKLAKAGKEIYPLPMFTNAWQKEHDDEKPGTYPCGAPLPEMLDIWKFAAPNLDVLSPDIYNVNFDKTASAYTREDNPLFIPETRRDRWAVAHLYTAIGTYNTLCYAPFGAESIGEDKSFITQILHTNTNDTNVSSTAVKEYLSQSYKLLGNMMPIVTKYYGTNNMIGFTQKNASLSQCVDVGKYRMRIEFYHPIIEQNDFIPSAGIVIQENENDFIFIGYGFKAYLETTNANMQLDFLSLEKGSYDKNANWITDMYLNGDEQRIQMEEKPTILRAKYYEF